MFYKKNEYIVSCISEILDTLAIKYSNIKTNQKNVLDYSLAENVQIAKILKDLSTAIKNIYEIDTIDRENYYRPKEKKHGN